LRKRTSEEEITDLQEVRRRKAPLFFFLDPSCTTPERGCRGTTSQPLGWSPVDPPVGRVHGNTATALCSLWIYGVRIPRCKDLISSLKVSTVQSVQQSRKAVEFRVQSASCLKAPVLLLDHWPWPHLHLAGSSWSFLPCDSLAGLSLGNVAERCQADHEKVDRGVVPQVSPRSRALWPVASTSSTSSSQTSTPNNLPRRTAAMIPHPHSTISRRPSPRAWKIGSYGAQR
jgi:hypothetical protein